MTEKTEINIPIFKRNNYFNGKQLTADDFRLEQEYFINRRNFFNSLYYGGGIVAGFQVTKKDKTTLTVSKGVAVDYEGRDIVLDTQKDVKFDYVPADGKDYVYLCLKYKPIEVKKTYNPWELNSGETPCIKIIDYHEFYLQKEEETAIDAIDRFDKINGYDLYMDRKLLFQNDSFIITQSIPRYACILSQIEIRIDIFKLKEMTSKISFEYTLDSANIKSTEGGTIDVSFSEKLHIDSQTYSLPKNAVVLEKMSDSETVTVKPGSFFVKLDDTVLASEPLNKEWRVEKVGADIKKHLRDLYMSQSLDSLLTKLVGFRLYLAKIYFTKEGSSYVISNIQNVPFNQYVDNVLLQRLFQSMNVGGQAYGNSLSEERVLELISASKDYMFTKISHLIKQYEKLLTTNPRVSSGVAEITSISYKSVTYSEAKAKLKDEIALIDKNESLSHSDMQRRRALTNLLHEYDRRKDTDILEILPDELKSLKKTNIFKSNTINHRLGSGYALIKCAIANGNTVYDGNTTIFDNSSLPKLEIGTEQNMSTGDFIIRVMFNEYTALEKITVAWTAIKESTDTAAFSIYNNDFAVYPPVYVAKRSSTPATITYKCMKAGKAVSNVIWASVQNECTPPDSTGKFTLPTQCGIYELTATAEGLTRSVFVCIMET